MPGVNDDDRWDEHDDQSPTLPTPPAQTTNSENLTSGSTTTTKTDSTESKNETTVNAPTTNTKTESTELKNETNRPPIAPLRQPLNRANSSSNPGSMLSVAIAADRNARYNRELRVRQEPDGVPVKDFYRALRYLNRRQQLCALFYYMIFFGLYLAVVLSLYRVEKIYSMTRAMEDVFLDEEFVAIGNDSPIEIKKNFYDIFSYDEYFQWVKGPLINGIFAETLYNGMPRSEGELLKIPGGLGGTRIISPIRFRTNRVKEGGSNCRRINDKPGDVFPTFWTEEVTSCFPSYSSATSDRSSWVHPFVDNLGSHVRGVSGYGLEEFASYGVGGYEFVLELHDKDGNVFTQDEILAKIDEQLINKRWADDATRLLVVEMNVFNFNLYSSLSSRFVVEIAPGGGFHNYYRMYQVMVQNALTNASSIINLVCQILFSIGLGVYIFEFLRVAKNSGRSLMYIFGNLWNFIDFLNLALSLCVICWIYFAQYSLFNNTFIEKLTGSNRTDYCRSRIEERSRRLIEMGNSTQDLGISDPDACFFDVYESARTLAYISYMASINIAIGLLKIFKYLRFFSRVTIMWDALAAAFPELLTLGLAYIVLTLAFALCGHLLFGAWVEDFHSVLNSVSTALRSVMGDFDYVAIRDVEPYTAPIYYTLFVFLQFFVLLNMSIAVVTEYYVKVKRDLDIRQSNQRTDNTLIVQSHYAVLMRRLGVSMLSVFYDGDSMGLMGWFPTGRRFRAEELTEEEATAAAAAAAAATATEQGGGNGPEDRATTDLEAGKRKREHGSNGRRRSSLFGSIFSKSDEGEGGGRRESRSSRSSHSARMRRAMRDVRKHFQSCPSNWEVSEFAPWVLRGEKERWIQRVRKDRKRGIRRSLAGTLKTHRTQITPAHKLWWWMVHHVAKAQKARRFMLVGQKAKEELKAEVERTRDHLFYLFGVETPFLRSWRTVLSEGSIRSRLKLFQHTAKQDRIRLRIGGIIRRAVRRQRIIHTKDLFTLFERTWMTMTPEHREGVLTKFDLMEVMGVTGLSPDYRLVHTGDKHDGSDHQRNVFLRQANALNFSSNTLTNPDACLDDSSRQLGIDNGPNEEPSQKRRGMCGGCWAWVCGGLHKMWHAPMKKLEDLTLGQNDVSDLIMSVDSLNVSSVSDLVNKSYIQNKKSKTKRKSLASMDTESEAEQDTNSQLAALSRTVAEIRVMLAGGEDMGNEW